LATSDKQEVADQQDGRGSCGDGGGRATGRIG